MSLLITLIKSPDSIAGSTPSMTFSESGGTLGRGPDNTWVLEDPELYLSTLHCEISFENGRYFIVDRSTNGTFYNGSVDPMGKGNQLPINEGDRFIIGDYEFAFSVKNQASNLSSANDPFSGSFDALSSEPSTANNDFGSSPFDSGMAGFSEPVISAAKEESDPLAALDKARGGAASFQSPSAGISSNPFPPSTQSDSVDPLNQQIDWPKPIAEPVNNPANVIPDDWDLDADEAPAPVVPTPQTPVPPAQAVTPAEPTARERALEIANRELLTQIEQLKKSQPGPAAKSAGSNNDSAFIRALGFEERSLSSDEIEKICHSAGEVMRAMVGGMMQVLSSRSSIKNEFRMNVTTIQPVENNPLKFSANVDDALENMFLKSGNAFKQPLEAVTEGFDSVAEHQVAILAGIREAFRAVIERFDPVILEERFSKQNRGSILPGSQKAKNWESFASYYEDLVGDIDKSFQYLFGDGFVRAYEDQLQKLAISKKSRARSKDSTDIESDQT